MKEGRYYDVMIYNGMVGALIKGKLLSTMLHSELRLYDFSAVQLQTIHHPKLPKGTPFDCKSQPWYIFKESYTGNIIPVYDGWIKEGGITEIDLGEIVLSGTFKSGKSMDSIRAAFHNESIYNMSLTIIGGDVDVVTDKLMSGTQYIITVDSTNKTKRKGVYTGSVSRDMLPSLGLNAEMSYREYTFAESHIGKLGTYNWLLFRDRNGKLFTIASELVDNTAITTNQGIYQFTKYGDLDDVAHIRSCLNILGAEDIVIGTTS